MQIEILLNNNFSAIVSHFLFSSTYNSDDYDMTFPNGRISLLTKSTTTKNQLYSTSENGGQDSDVGLLHFGDDQPTLINADNSMEITLFRGIRYFTRDNTTSLLHDIKYCTNQGVDDITQDTVVDKTTVKNTGSDQ